RRQAGPGQLRCRALLRGHAGNHRLAEVVSAGARGAGILLITHDLVVHADRTAETAAGSGVWVDPSDPVRTERARRLQAAATQLTWRQARGVSGAVR
ncbi:MAG: hypothetical protein M3143_07060, partial [Actinomycetota bacterium]|nr:hypothetical protein [Actinomycetota bacterium]